MVDIAIGINSTVSLAEVIDLRSDGDELNSILRPSTGSVKAFVG